MIGGVNNQAPARVNVPPQIANGAQIPAPGAHGANGANGASGPANAYLHTLRGPTQVAARQFGVGFFARIVRVGRAAVDAVRGAFTRMAEAHRAREASAAIAQLADNALASVEAAFADTTMTFTLPGTADSIEWSGRMFSELIAGLPKNERTPAMANLRQVMQSRINNGAQIYAQLRNRLGWPLPPGFPQADVQNVADLTLFMYAKATAQGDEFLNGSFNIGDPYGKIASWLDSSTENYARDSSHLKALQGKMIHEGDGRAPHKNVQRGIDIPKTLQTGLPAEFKTVCYGTITPLSGSGAHQRRLFLKAESFGCRLSPKLMMRSEKSIDSGISQRPLRFADIKQTLGHGKSYFDTRGQQGDLTCRKEHLPDSLKKLLEKAGKLDLSDATQETRDLFSTIIDSHCEKGGNGLRMLSAKIEEVAARATLPADERLCDFLDGLRTEIGKLPHNDRLDVRLGNEVIID